MHGVPRAHYDKFTGGMLSFGSGGGAGPGGGGKRGPKKRKRQDGDSPPKQPAKKATSPWDKKDAKFVTNYFNRFVPNSEFKLRNKQLKEKI